MGVSKRSIIPLRAGPVGLVRTNACSIDSFEDCVTGLETREIRILEIQIHQSSPVEAGVGQAGTAQIQR